MKETKEIKKEKIERRKSNINLGFGFAGVLFVITALINIIRSDILIGILFIVIALVSILQIKT